MGKPISHGDYCTFNSKIIKIDLLPVIQTRNGNENVIFTYIFHYY